MFTDFCYRFEIEEEEICAEPTCLQRSETFTIIECDDIDNISSDNVCPPMKFETPKQEHERACTENCIKLEETRENCGDTKYNYLETHL